MADIDSVDSSAERVLLMTIHSAKGLEFENVYLTGMEDGVFPGYMSITSEDSEDMEEERRLAYVGITRAKEDLTLTCARFRMLRGETQNNPVSVFVREIPEEMMEGNLPKRIQYSEPASSTARELMRTSPFGSARPKANVVKPAAKPYASKVSFATLQKGSAMTNVSIDYKEGDRVTHIKFGAGTVLSIEDRNGNKEVTVEFDSVGRRVLAAAFAKLKKL